MALLWILRTLASLFLGLLVFGAFLLWAVFSAVAADLELDDGSRVVALAEAAEATGSAEGADFLRAVERYHSGQDQSMGQARTFFLMAGFLGVAMLGLLQLPNPASALRWPAYTLMLTGGILLLSWLAQAALPNLVTDRTPPSASVAMVGLLRGAGTLGWWLAPAGALLLAASYGWARWRMKRLATSAPAPSLDSSTG